MKIKLIFVTLALLATAVALSADDFQQSSGYCGIEFSDRNSVFMGMWIERTNVRVGGELKQAIPRDGHPTRSDLLLELAMTIPKTSREFISRVHFASMTEGDRYYPSPLRTYTEFAFRQYGE